MRVSMVASSSGVARSAGSCNIINPTFRDDRKRGETNLQTPKDPLSAFFITSLLLAVTRLPHDRAALLELFEEFVGVGFRDL